jgi:hypothetical protein
MKKVFLPVAAILLFAILGYTSCVKKEFDSPPDTTLNDPNLPVNKTIWELKQMYTGVPTLIEDDITVAGVVVADDRSGNFYKQIIIQDTSSGMPVLINRSGLYSDFPIGRKVYIKCKGLYLGAYGGMVQIGHTPDNNNEISSIPSGLISKYVIKGKFDLSQVTARKVSIMELNNLNSSIKWLGTLIEIDSAQFVGSDVGVPFAQDPTISSATELEVEDCAETKIILRNSGYSTFKFALSPAGKGPLQAIYSRYNSTPQLFIRDTTDVQFNGPRCNALLTLQTIRFIRNMYPGTGNFTVPTGTKIKGVVISDKSKSNINSQNIAIQDATGGIIVRFSTSSGLPSLGDEVEVNLSGATLSEFFGVLQVGNLSSSKFIKTGTGTITPKVATIKQALDSLQVWESTLIKVNGATISGTPATYSGNKTLADGSGSSLTLFTFSSATFATTNYTTGTVSVTGILGEYTTSTSSTKQISIRNLNDVTP